MMTSSMRGPTSAPAEPFRGRYCPDWISSARCLRTNHANESKDGNTLPPRSSTHERADEYSVKQGTADTDTVKTLEKTPATAIHRGYGLRKNAPEVRRYQRDVGTGITVLHTAIVVLQGPSLQIVAGRSFRHSTFDLTLTSKTLRDPGKISPTRKFSIVNQGLVANLFEKLVNDFPVRIPAGIVVPETLRSCRLLLGKSVYFSLYCLQQWWVELTIKDR